MIKLCENCKKEFVTYQSKINLGKGKYCSRACSNTGKVELNCLICKKQFTTHQCKLDIGKGKYCSRKCYEISKRGIPSWNKGKSATWAIGNKYRSGKPNLYWRDPKNKKLGDKNNKWKGDNVGYFGLHNWVRNHLGKPQICEICKNKNLRPRQYHWANKSHEYLRDINDWIRLCVKCHKSYDAGKIQI